MSHRCAPSPAKTQLQLLPEQPQPGALGQLRRQAWGLFQCLQGQPPERERLPSRDHSLRCWGPSPCCWQRGHGGAFSSCGAFSCWSHSPCCGRHGLGGWDCSCCRNRHGCGRYPRNRHGRCPRNWHQRCPQNLAWASALFLLHLWEVWATIAGESLARSGTLGSIGPLTLGDGSGKTSPSPEEHHRDQKDL